MTDDDVGLTFAQTFAQERREQKEYVSIALQKYSTRSVLQALSRVECFARWMRRVAAGRVMEAIPGQTSLLKDNAKWRRQRS